MVSDGMSLGVPSLAEPFSRLIRKGPTHWYSLARSSDVSHGFFETGSLNSLVTDSAAASSAWNSGSRVCNHAINVLPNGQYLTPLGPLALAQGKRVGIVTTATVTHATPAGFLTAHPDRDNEDEIAQQIVNHAPHLLLGAGSAFSPLHRADQRDLIAEFRKLDYRVITTRAELKNQPKAERILGLFHNTHFPFYLDWKESPTYQKTLPTLAEMTTFALGHMNAAREGFFLQIEGARVDHGAHANDAAALLWEQLAFDDALGVSLQFIRENPDTLLVVTSDHATGNPGLNGVGPSYDQSSQAFVRLAGFNSSLAEIKSRLLLHPSPDSRTVTASVRESTGFTMTSDDSKLLLEALNHPAVASKNGLCSLHFVDHLAALLRPHTGIGWTGNVHTADLVPILALGPCRDYYQGLLKNTENFSRMASIFGIHHKNSSMSEHEASNITCDKSVGVYS